MQELALEPEVARDPVDGVAADGQLDRLEVDADLVGAAGLEPHLEERPLSELLEHLEPRHGLAWRLACRANARPVAAVAADRGRDPARPRARRPRTSAR